MIFKVISDVHVQRCKLGGKIEKNGVKTFLKVELQGVHGVLFFQV